MSDVFLSYSTKDKVIAGNAQRALARYGLDGFLAHESIQVSSEWQKRILQELNQCKMLIAVVTDEFSKSDWTGHEIGMAMQRKIVIAPIMIDKFMPKGFLAGFQAEQLDSSIALSSIRYPEVTINKILLDAISQHPTFALSIIDNLIAGIRDASSFDYAGYIAEVLAACGNLIGSKADWVFEYCLRNGQVYDSGSARPFLKSIWEQNVTHMNDDLKPRVLKKFEF